MSHTVTRPICPFCKNPMMQDGSWWSCTEGCNYDYNYSDSQGWHHKFDIDFENWACAINLYPDQDKTVVTAFRFMTEFDEGHERIEINHCLTGITPQNALEKLKLILMFS